MAWPNRRFTAIRNPLQASEFMDELAYAFLHFVVLRNHRLDEPRGFRWTPEGPFDAVFSSRAILVTAPEQAATVHSRVLRIFLQRHSTVPPSTYLENVAGQARQWSTPAGSGFWNVWSLRDAVCWSGYQPDEIPRESSCWLHRGGNWCGGIRRLVGAATIAVELGLRFCNRETHNGLMSNRPRPRACEPRQELAFGIHDRSGRGCPRRARSARSVHYRCRPQPLEPLAGSAGCGGGAGGLVSRDKRGAGGPRVCGQLARTQPLRKVSLRRRRARLPCRPHAGVRPVRLPERRPHVLRHDRHAQAADRRWLALRRHRGRFADWGDARAAQAATVVASADHARMRNPCAARAVWGVYRNSHH